MQEESKKTFDVSFLEQIEHRMNLLEKNNKEIQTIHLNQKQNITEEQERFNLEIEQIRENLEEIKKLTQTLRKTIFSLGHQLKKKVTKNSLAVAQERIDAWPLENYLTKKEMPVLYDKYAKQQ